MVTTLKPGASLWPGISVTVLPAPGKYKCHPGALEAQAQVADFARRWQILPPTFEAYNTMFSFVYPATSLARLVTIGKIFCIFFYLDDVLLDVLETQRPVSKLETIGACLKVFQTGQLPTHPTRLERAVQEVREEILAQANEQWLKRFATTVVAYLQTSRQFSAKPDLGAELDNIEDYLRLRELDSGTYTGMDLIEFAQDNYLPAEILNHPAIQDLREMAAWIWAGMNDLISYHKEIVLNRPGSNMLSWLVNSQKMPLEVAAGEVINLVNSLVLDFNRKLANLPDLEDEKLNLAMQQYVSGLQDLVAAAWH
jgi:hypothetical protein